MVIPRRKFPSCFYFFFNPFLNTSIHIHTYCTCYTYTYVDSGRKYLVSTISANFLIFILICLLALDLTSTLKVSVLHYYTGTGGAGGGRGSDGGTHWSTGPCCTEIVTSAVTSQHTQEAEKKQEVAK